MNKEWNEAAEKLYKIKQARKYYSHQEENCLEELKRLSGGLPATGDVFKLRAVIRPGAIDYEKIVELSEIDLNLYRKAPVTSWIISEKITLPKMEISCSNQ